EKLFGAIRTCMNEKKLGEKMRATIFDAEDRNNIFREDILKHSHDDVINLLTKTGFDCEHVIPSAYVDAVMIVRDKKPLPKVDSAEPTVAAPQLTLDQVELARDQVFVSY